MTPTPGTGKALLLYRNLMPEHCLIAGAYTTSTGDLMSQKHANGGLGLGTVWISALFLGTILALVVYLRASAARTRSRPLKVKEGAP